MSRKLVGPCTMRPWCTDAMLWVSVTEDLAGGVPVTTVTLEHAWGARGGRACVGMTVDGLRGRDEEWKRGVVEQLVVEMDWQHSKQPSMFTPADSAFRTPDDRWGPTGGPETWVNRDPVARDRYREHMAEHEDEE